MDILLLFIFSKLRDSIRNIKNKLIKRWHVESDRQINVTVTLWRKSLTTWVSSLVPDPRLCVISCCFLCPGGSLIGAAGQQVSTESTGRVEDRTTVDISIDSAELSSGCKTLEWDCERRAGVKRTLSLPFPLFSKQKKKQKNQSSVPHQRRMASLL